ncbi:MAG: hypothetical protein WC455_07400 [Dehalococcoidia bacterium]|jgi:hypothetical protein
MDQKKSEVKIYEQGIEEFGLGSIIFGNMTMLVWIMLGMTCCWFFHPIAAWVYLGVALLMVFVVMRRIVCVNCYYYGKLCPIGWGKLAALMFKQGSMDKFATSIGVRLAPATYGLLSLIPLGLVIAAMVQDFMVAQAIVLVELLAISAYSGASSRKKSCVNCKMRYACPGCVVKEKSS